MKYAFYNRNNGAFVYSAESNEISLPDDLLVKECEGIQNLYNTFLDLESLEIKNKINLEISFDDTNVYIENANHNEYCSIVFVKGNIEKILNFKFDENGKYTREISHDSTDHIYCYIDSFKYKSDYVELFKKNENGIFEI